MSVFKTITPNDILITPFEVHKTCAFNSLTASSSYAIDSYQGIYKWWVTNQADMSDMEMQNYPTTANGQYKYVIHSSINHMFYDKFKTLPLSTLSKVELSQNRTLHERVNILSIPQIHFAEKIKEGSVNISDFSCCESGLLLDPFMTSSTAWTQSFSYDIEASESLFLFPYSSSTAYDGNLSKKTWFAFKAIHSASDSASWVDNICITASLTNDIEPNVSYKVVVDINNVSKYYVSDPLITIDDPISSMIFQISGTGGDAINIEVPFDKSRYEYDISSSTGITSPHLICYVTQSIDIGSIAGYEEFKPMIVSASINRIQFNEVNIFKRGDVPRMYVDDERGNLYDTVSSRSCPTSHQLNGEWLFSDGYIDARDERRYNSTADTSIYNNTGTCTNVSFIDGTHGKAAYFNINDDIVPLVTGQTMWTASFIGGDYGSIGTHSSLSASLAAFMSNVIYSETTYPQAPTDNYSYVLYDCFVYAPTNPTSLTYTNIPVDTTALYRISYWAKHSYSSGSANTMTPYIQHSILQDGVEVDTDVDIWGLNPKLHIHPEWYQNTHYFYIPDTFSGSFDIKLKLGNESHIVARPSTNENKNEFLLLTDLRVDKVTADANIRVYNNDAINFDTFDEFAIECIINPALKQQNIKDGDRNIIITKNGRYKEFIHNQVYHDALHNDNSGSTYYLPPDEMNVECVGKYPFEISMFNHRNKDDGKVLVQRYDGNTLLALSSSNTINDGRYHHIIYQKSASNLELYIDGTLAGTCADYCSTITTDCTTRLNVPDVRNKSDLFIGARGDDAYNFTGCIDTIRIYDAPLSAADINSLYESQLITNTYYYQIGNVFYEQGFITVTNPYHRYDDTFLFSGSNSTNIGYSGSFKNNLTLYEVEVQCPVEPAEYNFSLNKSSRARADISNDMVACFVTHSQFTPYVTTVGLYNENAELVAVGKLSKPIKKLNDVDITFVVRVDV